MKKYKILFYIIGLILLSNHLFASNSLQGLVASKQELATITINGIKIDVEMAITTEEHRHGLMFREKMEKNHGMIFAFPVEQRVSFWMKNTIIPLSVAFIKEDGWISQIDDMVPKSLDSHVSEMKVKYVLEMNKGWFEDNGVKVGDVVKMSD